MLTESAAHRAYVYSPNDQHAASLAGNHPRQPSTNQSRLDRDTLLIYAIATLRHNDRAQMFTVDAGDAATARPRSCYCMYDSQNQSDVRSTDSSAAATKIARPFGDDGNICCCRRHTLSMSRPQRRRQVECQFGITRLLRPLSDARRGHLRATAYRLACRIPKNAPRRAGSPVC